MDLLCRSIYRDSCYLHLNVVRDLYNEAPANKKYPNKTPWDSLAYLKETNCHICEGFLGKDKVWNHCHFTGEY